MLEWVLIVNPQGGIQLIDQLGGGQGKIAPKFFGSKLPQMVVFFPEKCHLV